MRIKTTRPYFTESADRRDDGGRMVFILRASKRDARRLLQRRRFRKGGPIVTRLHPEMEGELLDRGLIQPYGCDCSHCAMDYDCCGRLYPAHVDAERVRGGVRITQRYYRNI